MPRLLAVMLLAATAAAVAVAPAARAASLPEAVGDEVAIGKNAAGEPCRLRLEFQKPEQEGLTRYALYCQGWNLPSGQLRRFASRRAAAELLRESGYQKALETRVGACGDPQETTILDGAAPAVLRACRRLEGGWPVVVFVSRVGNVAYAAEAVPVNGGLLEAAIAVLEKKREPEPGGTAPTTALIRRLETIVGTSATLVGVQEIGAVQDLKKLGLHYIYARSWGRAEATYRRALEIVTRSFGAEDPSNGDILSGIGLSQYGLYRLTEAEATFSRAEPLVRRSVPADIRRFTSYKSGLRRLQGRNDEAVAMAAEATKYARDTNQPAAGLGTALMFEAEALIGAGRYAEAIGTAEDAIRAYVRGYGPTHPLIATTYLWIGRSNLEQRQFPAARAAFEKSAAMRQALFGESWVVAEAQLYIGNTYGAEGKKDLALASYRKAVENAARDPLNLNNLGREQIAPYLALAADDPGTSLAPEAFLASQLPRAGLAAHAIAAMAARVASDDPGAAKAARELQDANEKLNRLRARLAALLAGESDGDDDKAAAGAGASAAPAAAASAGATPAPAPAPTPAAAAAASERLSAEIREAAGRAEASERRLQAEFPRYAELVSPKPVAADELGRLMRPGEAMLSVTVTRAAAYVFLVRDARVRMHRSELSEKALDEAVAGLRRALDTPGSVPRRFDLAAAHDLYLSLFGPLADGLKGVRHLIVVPGGALASLPLGVLVTEAPVDKEVGDYTRQPFLARDMAMSWSPTVAAFRDLRRSAARPSAPEPFIGFGDPDFAGAGGDQRGLQKLGETCRGGEGIDVGLLKQLPRLPESAAEVRAIAAALKAPPASAITGAKASEAAVRAADLSRYRVVAFATHGLLPRVLRCQNEPALALTPPANPKGREDGLLDASEIAALKLNADWVILSACDTAGPNGLGGEALSGLARAFFYAGARAVMASHWPVFSGPTVTLTTGTIGDYAKRGKEGKAAALQRAQLALLANAATSHPVYWAPFVLVGDGG
ncbi:MAG TPA: CHAT domain-containing tetratricopeptide repeat protein [Stellaceae bacterium]